MPRKFVSRNRLLAAVRSPAWICFVWFGMTAGISLLATPLRFTAPAITRPVAFDVGRVVFAGLNNAEFVALIIMLVLVRVSGLAKKMWAGCCAVALILIAQSLWLLPELSARARQIVAGEEVPPSYVHAAYSILELSKLLLLLYLGFVALQNLARSASHADSED